MSNPLENEPVLYILEMEFGSPEKLKYCTELQHIHNHNHMPSQQTDLLSNSESTARTISNIH